MLAVADDHETDDGPRSLARVTERFCVATRTVRPVEELIRFVVGPDGTVVPDLKRKLPGRGVWVTGTRDAVATAVKSKAFARGFRRDVKTPADLGAMVERLIEASALDALGIAHKAGLTAIGFAKTEAALAGEVVVALLHAADAAPDGTRKIMGAARARFEDDLARVAVVEAFTSAQLDLALGRSNVVHAALLAGPASNGFIARCHSLERFRTQEPGGGRGRAVRDH
jgi:predicted RNA-binding protein YlxR (DUF448 family)